MARGYRTDETEGERTEVPDALEALICEGARRMLAAALEEGVAAFLGRGRSERGTPFRGSRNGCLPPRDVAVGVGTVEVRVPRVANVPPEVSPDGFQSQVVRGYERAS